jgi:hypothetical protein
MPKKSKRKQRKSPTDKKKQPRKPTKVEIVGSRFAGVHNQALSNSARDTTIRERIKERMKEETNEARLLDLERRRLELLK